MRCFISAEVCGETRKKIYEFAKRLDREKFKIVDEKNIHITIKFLGDIGDDEIAMCRKAIDECTSRCNNIKVKMSGGGAFPSLDRARVIFVNVFSKELEMVANCIHNKTKGIGDEKPYVGHITIARVRNGSVGAYKIVEELKSLNIDEYIKKIALIKSTLTPNGPVYEEVYAKL
ncbi:MAG: RNA 2',3'-cyclic phosphodiesterase [Candidatus Micrarchaeia archaeon]